MNHRPKYPSTACLRIFRPGDVSLSTISVIFTTPHAYPIQPRSPKAPTSQIIISQGWHSTSASLFPTKPSTEQA